MSFKKLSIIPFCAIVFVLATYVYGSYKDSAKAPISDEPQIADERPVIAKEPKIVQDKKVEAAKFKPISDPVPAPAPAPKAEPEIEPKVELSWKEEQAIHRAEIDRLEALKKNFPRDSDEYREIEDKIYLELEDMGLTVYQTEGGGGINHTPNYEWIAEVSKDFDPELQNKFAAEISAVDELIDQREEIEAEKRANRRGEREHLPELIERDQRLVAQEFRFSRENPQFWEALNSQYEQVSD